jgi:hypothetical protein
MLGQEPAPYALEVQLSGRRRDHRKRDQPEVLLALQATITSRKWDDIASAAARVTATFIATIPP